MYHMFDRLAVFLYLLLQGNFVTSRSLDIPCSLGIIKKQWILSSQEGGNKMFCNRCGSQVSDLYRFCNICGNPLVLPIPNTDPFQPIELLPPVPQILPLKAEASAPTVEQLAHSDPAPLIRSYDVPESVKRGHADIKTLELYGDRLVCIKDSGLQVTLLLAQYTSVGLITAGKDTQYAQIVLIPKNQSDTYDLKKNINSLNYPNKLPFCSGLLNTQPANAFAEALYQDIQAAIRTQRTYEAG